METTTMEMRSMSRPETTWFEKVVLVHQQREEVFEELATLEFVPRWHRSIEGIPPQGSFELAGYEPPGRLTLAGFLGPFEVLLEYDLGEIALGTVVTVRVELQPAGSLPDDTVWVGLVSDLQAQVAASLERLKRLPGSES
jgi:hypothetical protein